MDAKTTWGFILLIIIALASSVAITYVTKRAEHLSVELEQQKAVVATKEAIIRGHQTYAYKLEELVKAHEEKAKSQGELIEEYRKALAVSDQLIRKNELIIKKQEDIIGIWESSSPARK